MGEIVIIEDDSKLQRAWRRALCRAGHRVHPALCFQQGSLLLSELLRSRVKVDLILLDLVLPDGNGLELLPAARELERARGGGSSRCHLRVP